MPLCDFALRAVEGDQAGQGALEVGGIEAVEGLRAHRRLGQHLPGDREHQRPPPRVLQGVGDRQIRHRPGVQHGPVGLLAPEEAQDVAGRLRVGQRRGQLADPFADAAAGFPDPEGPDVALHDQPGLQPVRAEVHEGGQHPARPDRRGQRFGRQAVLEADHVTVRRETPAEKLGRGRGVVALGGHRGPRQGGGEAIRQHRSGLHREVLDRPADGQAPPVDGLDMGGIGIAEENVMTVTDQVGTDGAADGTGADNRQLQEGSSWSGSDRRLRPRGGRQSWGRTHGPPAGPGDDGSQ